MKTSFYSTKICQLHMLRQCSWILSQLMTQMNEIQDCLNFAHLIPNEAIWHVDHHHAVSKSLCSSCCLHSFVATRKTFWYTPQCVHISVIYSRKHQKSHCSRGIRLFSNSTCSVITCFQEIRGIFKFKI